MSVEPPGCVLGFDTSTSVTTVAVVDAKGAQIAQRNTTPDPDQRPAHASDLLVAIEQCVEGAGGWDGIGRIGVGVGPGSYTGVRVSVSTGRALAQASGKEVVGVSSLAALALGVTDDPVAAERPSMPVIDARRDEAFVAVFDTGRSEIIAPSCVTPNRFAEVIGRLDPPPLAAGDGALRFAEDLEAAGAEVLNPESPSHSISAVNICRLALEAEPARVEAIEPIYLREPDARRWLDRDDQRSG